MLAQVEAKGKVSFANRNGKPYISDCSDTQVAKLKPEKELLSTNSRVTTNCKSQESTTSSEGEHREGACRVRFQEQEG